MAETNDEKVRSIRDLVHEALADSLGTHEDEISLKELHDAMRSTDHIHFADPHSDPKAGLTAVELLKKLSIAPDHAFLERMGHEGVAGLENWLKTKHGVESVIESKETNMTGDSHERNEKMMNEAQVVLTKQGKVVTYTGNAHTTEHDSKMMRETLSTEEGGRKYSTVLENLSENTGKKNTTVLLVTNNVRTEEKVDKELQKVLDQMKEQGVSTEGMSAVMVEHNSPIANDVINRLSALASHESAENAGIVYALAEKYVDHAFDKMKSEPRVFRRRDGSFVHFNPGNHEEIKRTRAVLLEKIKQNRNSSIPISKHVNEKVRKIPVMRPKR